VNGSPEQDWFRCKKRPGVRAETSLVGAADDRLSAEAGFDATSTLVALEYGLKRNWVDRSKT